MWCLQVSTSLKINQIKEVADAEVSMFGAAKQWTGRDPDCETRHRVIAPWLPALPPDDCCHLEFVRLHIVAQIQISEEKLPPLAVIAQMPS